MLCALGKRVRLHASGNMAVAGSGRGSRRGGAYEGGASDEPPRGGLPRYSSYGCQRVKLPTRSPHLNAFAERFMGAIIPPSDSDADSITSALEKFTLRAKASHDKLVARAGGSDEQEALLRIKVVLASGLVRVAL